MRTINSDAHLDAISKRNRLAKLPIVRSEGHFTQQPAYPAIMRRPAI